MAGTAAGFLLGYASNNAHRPAKAVSVVRDTIELKMVRQQELYRELQKSGIPHPEWWLRLAIGESGVYLQSDFARLHNNPFGMMCRDTFSVSRAGCVEGHQRYASFADACKDLKKWYDLSPARKDESFVVFLHRRGYNQNPDYGKYISSIQPF